MAGRVVQYMAPRLVLATLLLCSGAAAQSSDCTSALVSLSPCLNYITGNETTPSSACCSQLASVATSDPMCLCMVLNGSASTIGITVNKTQAMALPGACNVQTPPVSLCSTGGAPTPSPATPPTTPSGSAPSGAAPSGSAPSGGGSKTAPSVDNNTSGGSQISALESILMSVFLVAAASCFSSHMF